MLAKDASFRLIVTGNIGVKEIERLIKKLELDKEILADQERRGHRLSGPYKPANLSGAVRPFGFWLS